MFSPTTYQQRRTRLISLMDVDNVSFILPSNPIKSYSYDKNFRYRQNSDLMYFSGIEQHHSVLIIEKNNGNIRSILFLLERDPDREQWDGKLLSQEAAVAMSGVELCRDLSELKEVVTEILDRTTLVGYQQGLNEETDQIITPLLDNRKVIDPLPHYHQLRVVKSAEEIEIIRESVRISMEGHRQAIKQSKPGIKEYEIAAIYEYEFKRRGGVLPTEEINMSSGPETIILHNHDSNRVINSGELILTDTGTEYSYYTSDITRTWPVDGTFSTPQKEIYKLVLDTHRACIALAGPGVLFWDIHQLAVEKLTRGLVELGLLSGDVTELIETDAYKRYFMHGIGHWLGIDTHDCPSIPRETTVLEPGHYITIEPGIYIPEEEDIPEQYCGIGIRIEDNVLITASGAEVLSSNLPVEIDKIEELVAGK